VSDQSTRTMISFEDAQHVIQERATLANTVVEVAAQYATGYILAEEIISTINMPGFNKSAMDGFAFRHVDINDGDVFTVVGKVAAGDSLEIELGTNECVRIMTGAPAPTQCDTVVPIEDTIVLQPTSSKPTESNVGNDQADQIRFQTIPDRGKNLALKGEDITDGMVALKEGGVIMPADVSILATLGRSTVKVYQPPTIAFAATGKEVVEPGVTLGPGQIYNANAYIIWSQLNRLNCQLNYLGVIRDDLEDLRSKLSQGLESDILVLSGGVSMGEFDYVPQILDELGVEIIFHHLLVKPGKPTLFGKRGNTMVFGLPGNPVSTMYCFDQYVAPAIRAFQHHPRPLGIRYTGEISDRILKKTGRLQLLPCLCEWVDGKYMLNPIKNHGSADVFSIKNVNALAILPAADKEIKRGQMVGFRKLFE